MTTLLLTGRFGKDDQVLWHVAVERGWPVERLRGAQVPPIDDPEVVVYAEAFYAPLIEAALGIHLLDPPEDWLANLTARFLHRDVQMMTLQAARRLDRPAFIKPPNDKSFKAAVYSSGASLPAEFDESMNVLVAEPVEWESEFRCFMLDGTVRTLSPYLRCGELAELEEFRANNDELRDATQFAEAVAADSAGELPSAIALDVGVVRGRGWAVVEANGAWGSGIYGCNPDAVLDVIRRAVTRGQTQS